MIAALDPTRFFLFHLCPSVFICGENSSNVRVSDADDIQATLAGDGEAYRRIIDRHQAEVAKRLRRFARAGDRNTLEQLVHDTFVEAYFSLSRYRGDAPLIHWLHRIAVRVGYKHWKSQKQSRATVSLDDRDIATKSNESSVDADQLHQVLEQLSPRDRLVVTLMYLEGPQRRRNRNADGMEQNDGEGASLPRPRKAAKTTANAEHESTRMKDESTRMRDKTNESSSI
jgi:RNA polymerase sigma-70 factor (ECF subfamily)